MSLNLDRMRRYRRPRAPRSAHAPRMFDEGRSVACSCGWSSRQLSDQMAGVAWGCHLISLAGQEGL